MLRFQLPMEVFLIEQGCVSRPIIINTPNEIQIINIANPVCRILYNDKSYSNRQFLTKYKKMYKEAYDKFWAARPGINVIATGIPAMDGTSVPIMAPHFKSGEIEGLNFTSASQDGKGD